MSNAQEKDSIKVSKNALTVCELEHNQLEFVTAQLDSVVKDKKPKPLGVKEKSIWAIVGAVTITLIRITLK